MFECTKQLLLITLTAGYQLVLFEVSLRKETLEMTSEGIELTLTLGIFLLNS